MTLRWTPSQEAAITSRGTDLLVAAGAGAGKTAVLVERVLRRISDPDDPVDVDELLLVTFTDAAAAEMRGRIAERLRNLSMQSPDSARWTRALVLLERADICTIHAFCLGLLRKHFHRLGLDPGFRVLDEHEAFLLRREVLDDLLEQRFSEKDSAFSEMVARYGGRSGEKLALLVERIHQLAETQPDPEAWLQQQSKPFQSARESTVQADHADGNFTVWEGMWLPDIVAQIRMECERAGGLLEQAATLCGFPGGPAAYMETLAADQALFASLREEISRLENALQASSGGEVPAIWENLRALIAGSAFQRLPVQRGEQADPELTERVKRLREQAKRVLEELKQGPFARSRSEEASRLAALAPSVEEWVAWTRAFRRAYARAKEAAGALDFSDLERLGLQLLQEIDLRGRYREVIVDEYQDINPLQEAILASVSGDGREHPRNRFLVGDVRQSIYRFRLAEPAIFLERYRRSSRGDMKTDAEERCIDLSVNFRSRPAILDAVNRVFRRLFASAIGELGYDPTSELRPGTEFPGPDPPVEVHVLERHPRSSEQASGNETGEPEATATGEADPLRVETVGYAPSEEREAVLVAKIIRRLLAGKGSPPATVWDPKTGAQRPVQPGDIAVLLRSPRHRANTFVSILTEEGIPAKAELRTGYFGALEVVTFLALLRVLDNPRRDIPLATFLHSPMGGYDADELARIRLADRKGCLYDACLAAAAGEGSHVEPPLRERMQATLRKLDAWRTFARRIPLGDLVWRVFRETGYLDYVAAMPGGAQRRANLERILAMARSFDRFARPGLPRFLRFLDRLQERDQDLGASTPPTPAPGAVTILSIHQSKGREFPVVILADAGRPFHLSDLHEPVLLHRELGIGPLFVDPGRGVEAETLARRAVARRLKAEALAEEMRVLYVAMTRARERLVIIGSVTDLENKAREWLDHVQANQGSLSDGALAASSHWLDWLLPCIALDSAAGVSPPRQQWHPIERAWQAPAGDPPTSFPWRVQFWDGTSVAELRRSFRTGSGIKLSWEALAQGSPPELPEHPDVWERVLSVERDLQRRLSTLGFDGDRGLLPAKLTVTDLQRLPGPEADPDAWEEPGAAWQELAATGEVLEGSPPPWEPTPLFLGRDDPAEAARETGTAVHLVLRHLDLSGSLAAPAIAEQIQAMVGRELLTREQAERVNAERIAAFFATELGRRLVAAADRGRLKREWSFSLRWPAADLFPRRRKALENSPGEAWILVQGTLDAVWEESGRLVLIDWKTDRLEGESGETTPASPLRRRARMYAAQIRAYARAASALTGKPVGEAYLVFLHPGVAVPMQPEGPLFLGPAAPREN